MEYKFGNKNNWRRRLWNEISDRVGPNKKDAIVLYLPGPKDLDRPVAISKGFVHANLLAVEKDEETARNLRKRGVPVLIGDIFSIAQHWPKTTPISAFVADLCCGLNDEIHHVLGDLCFAPHMIDCTFAVNLLRGRDPKSAKLRNAWGERIEAKISEDDGWGYLRKHRGAMLLYGVSIAFGFCNARNQLSYDDARFDALWTASKKAFIELCNAEAISYRSVAHQTFDTCIFKSPVKQALKNAGIPEEDAVNKAMEKAFVRDAEKARQIAAILAHRTMRMRRIGPYAKRWNDVCS